MNRWRGGGARFRVRDCGSCRNRISLLRLFTLAHDHGFRLLRRSGLLSWLRLLISFGHLRDADVACLFPLFVDKRVDDLSRERSRGFCAPASMLTQHSDDDIGIAAWHHADKPGIGALLSSSQACCACTVIHYLSRTCLAGEVDALKTYRACGPARPE